MLPDLFPDMTLYSLCACAHRMSDRSCASETSAFLFGDRRAGLLQDFPYALDAFCANTAGRYGTSSDLVRIATTLPYFTRFRPASVAVDLAAGLAGHSRGRFKFNLGLPASPLGAKFPLRACVQCMREDTSDFGTAYWRRRHQLPGVWICDKHAYPLCHSPFRIDRRRNSCYIMPADPGALSEFARTDLGDDTTSTLLRLAILSATLLDTPLPCEYTAERLRHAYLHGLNAQGLLTRRGKVRTQALIKLLHSRFRAIANLPPFDWVLCDRHIHGLARLVRRPRSDIHTTYHVLMIDALFGGWTHFAKVYEWEAAILPQSDRNCTSEKPKEKRHASDPRVEAIAVAAKKEGQSLSSLCRVAGVDYQTVLRRVAATGALSVVRRPKILTEALRSAVIAALSSGRSQREVVKTLGLSRATVDRICVETPGLHTSWYMARHARVRDAERCKMLAFLEQNRGISRVEARKAGGNGYSWLSRHDHDWLNSAIPAHIPDRRHNNSTRHRVNWDARDRECLAALEAAATGVLFEPTDRLKPGVVLRKLPRLSFSPRLDRLPAAKDYVLSLVTTQQRKRNVSP